MIYGLSLIAKFKRIHKSSSFSYSIIEQADIYIVRKTLKIILNQDYRYFAIKLNQMNIFGNYKVSSYINI